MRIVRKDLPHKHFYIVPLYDLHRGSDLFVEKKLDEYIGWIAERENAYTLLGGDLGEYPTRTSKTSPFEATNAQEQMDWEYGKFLPIRDKILGIIQGNHEFRLFDFSGIDTSMILAHRLGVPYGREGIYLSIGIGGRPERFTVYAVHGWSNGRKVGGKVNALDDLSHIVHADVVLLGHSHLLECHRYRYFMPNKPHTELVEMRKVLVSCGSFLGYGGYVQRRGMMPAEIGAARIRFERKGHGNRKDVHVSV